MQSILNKIDNRELTIGIIGLGYVGLPLAIRFSEEKFNVIGFDINEEKIKSIQSGNSFIKHIANNKILFLLQNDFIATNSFKNISDVDIIIICVPTPLGANKEPDLSYIHSTIESISPYLKKPQILILESTTYPGTTEEEIVPKIENLGFSIGKDFFVGYSPEREDPGNTKFSTKTIPKIVSGHTQECLKIIENIYSTIVDCIVPVSSMKAAEMTKILENIHRAVNIGLVNELKIVADKMNIDIYEVINAAATKPFGFTAFYPGPGLGGHCIPIDPFYLTWKAKKIGVDTKFIELAGEINTKMPEYVIHKIGFALKDVDKTILKSKILILGLAYKKNVDDTRESPSLEIIHKLTKLGAYVECCDPYVNLFPKIKKYNIQLHTKKLDATILQNSDVVVLITDHDIFDYELIQKNAKIIVDTRGRFNKNKNIIKA